MVVNFVKFHGFVVFMLRGDMISAKWDSVSIIHSIVWEMARRRYSIGRGRFELIWKIIKPRKAPLPKRDKVAGFSLGISSSDHDGAALIANLLKVKVVIEELSKTILRNNYFSEKLLAASAEKLCKRYEASEFRDDVIELVRTAYTEKSQKPLSRYREALSPTLKALLVAVKKCIDEGCPCTAGNLVSRYSTAEYATISSVTKLADRAYARFLSYLKQEFKIDIEDRRLGKSKAERLYWGLAKAGYFDAH